MSKKVEPKPSPLPWHWWSERKDRPKNYDLDGLYCANGQRVLTYYSNGELTPDKKLIRDAVNQHHELKSQVKRLEELVMLLKADHRRLRLKLSNANMEIGRLKSQPKSLKSGWILLGFDMFDRATYRTNRGWTQELNSAKVFTTRAEATKHKRMHKLPRGIQIIASENASQKKTEQTCNCKISSKS